jgi:NADH-quinone oxidoreductase subunit G
MTEDKKTELVTINIDGRDVDVPAGMNLIDAAKQFAGVEIPHYCYHSKLSVAGNCRMCLVEMGTPMMDRASGKPLVEEDGRAKIGWMPKPAIACSTRTSAGLHVKTQSAIVQECRNGVMEFLLLNHPLDCPICDQAGECRLQQFSTDYGRGYSRYIEAKNVKPKRSRIGPRITLDDERCILCSRCVRFSEEITKDAVLGFVDRGSYSTLTCYPGREFDSNYSLNVVDLCPVGALTDTDFRFKMRVWFLKPTSSICTESSVGVNTTVWSREGRIYRITPRQNDAVNDTWMSDSGRRIFHRFESDDRIRETLVAGVASPRATAMERAAILLKSGKVGIVVNGQASIEEQQALRALAVACGARVWFMPKMEKGDGFLISNDRSPNLRGALLTGLIESIPSEPTKSLRLALESGEVHSLLVVGEDLSACGIAPELLSRVKMVYLGPLHNAASAQAEVVLPGLSVFEKDGAFVNQSFRLQRFEKAIPAPSGCCCDLQTFADLRVALGDSKASGELKLVWQELSSSVPELAGMNWQSIPSGGVLLDGSRFDQLSFCEGPSLRFPGCAVAGAQV